MIDARVTLLRPDLAPAEYEGVAVSRIYHEVRRVRSTAPVSPMRASPEPRSEQVSQLLYGEEFDILREERGFAWGQARRDGYVGWVASETLTSELAPPSHWVTAPRAAVLAEPRIRAPTSFVLGMNALVAVGETRDAFSNVEGLGWLATAHLAAVGAEVRSPCASVQMFIGTPYVWGGRDGGGLDCSGLIQQALFAAGRACPRDADQQAALGVGTSLERLAAGDLVVWKGHIGMMLDAERLIHANAHHMAVAIEPLRMAIDRIDRAGSGLPTAYRRLNSEPRSS